MYGETSTAYVAPVAGAALAALSCTQYGKTMRLLDPHPENRDRRRYLNERRKTQEIGAETMTDAIRDVMIALAAMTDDGRERLKTPWSTRYWSYATDGKMAIRAPRLDEFGERGDNDDITKGIDPLVSAAAGPTWYDVPANLPAAPVTMTCPRCNGQRRRECDACESTGTATFELWHKSIRYTVSDTCPVCNGECGDCQKCNGKGAITPEEPPVEVGPALIRADFLRLMARLPGCRLAPVDSRSVVVFEFDSEGRGAVMPVWR